METPLLRHDCQLPGTGNPARPVCSDSSWPLWAAFFSPGHGLRRVLRSRNQRWKPKYITQSKQKRVDSVGLSLIYLDKIVFLGINTYEDDSGKNISTSFLIKFISLANEFQKR
jgi:hypothetical protein